MTRDPHRRITGYTRDEEWDATERDWMLALDDYERSLCPLCGLPRDVCHDAGAEFSIGSEATVCWATAHMSQAAEQWRKEHPDSPNANALTTSITY